MNEVERIHKILTNLRLRGGEYILNGSGVLALHGIDRGRPMGDMDIFCTTSQWFDLLFGRHLVLQETVDQFDEPIRVWVKWEVFTTDGTDEKRMCDPPYLYAKMYGLEVNIFYNWRQRPEEGGAGDMYIPHYIRAAEVVQGWPCAPLGFIIAWKLSTGRTKDLTDVIAIREHLHLPERSEA